MRTIDKAHSQTNATLTALERCLRTLYSRTNKQIQANIAPLLAQIYLEKEDATQRERIKYADQHGLKKIVGIFTDHMLDTNETAIKTINRTLLGIYNLNFTAMARFFKREVGIDITKGEENEH